MSVSLFHSSHMVVIIGAGPTGLFLALRLVQVGIQVIVVEAKKELDSTSRALTHMPSIYPEYKKVGILDDVLAAAGDLRSTGALFRKASDKSVIAQIPNVPGRPGPCVLPQSAFSRILLRKVEEHNCQHVIFGNVFERYQEREGGGVSVFIRDSEGIEKTIEADFIVAADGGKSSLRKAADIAFEGETLPYQLVATDLRYPVEQFGWDPLMPNFLADPECYGLVTPIDGKGLWRCSFGMPLKDGKTPSADEINSIIPTRFQHMLPSAPGEQPRDWELVHIAPYKAQQLCAETFKKGSVLLIGDAAHLTNPYAGMGLNSGIFDAASLADALTCILQRGGTRDSLLDGWAMARKSAYTKVVDPISRAAFAAFRDPDVETLPQRHPMLKATRTPGAKPPELGTDVSKFEGWVS